MKLNWNHWFYTLLKTVIGGAAAAGSAWLATVVGNQVDTGIPVLQFKQLWAVLLSSTLLNLFFFLKQSPLPEDTDENKPSAPPVGVWLLFWCGLALFLSGCAGSLDRQVFKIEGAALGTADGAMKGYALYYKAATNNPAAFNRTRESLALEIEQVKALSQQVGAAGEMVQTLRLSYKTNAAVEPALQASLLTLQNNMAGIVTFVTNVIHIKPGN